MKLLIYPKVMESVATEPKPSTQQAKKKGRIRVYLELKGVLLLAAPLLRELVNRRVTVLYRVVQYYRYKATVVSRMFQQYRYQESNSSTSNGTNLPLTKALQLYFNTATCLRQVIFYQHKLQCQRCSRGIVECPVEGRRSYSSRNKESPSSGIRYSRSNKLMLRNFLLGQHYLNKQLALYGIS